VMLKIKFMRINRRMTQWDMGREAGMSQARYSLVERRLIKPTPEECARFAQILGTSPAALFRPVFRERKSQEESVAHAPNN
jgi:transcriptional regulator with XRE-family HTH domain